MPASMKARTIVSPGFQKRDRRAGRASARPRAPRARTCASPRCRSGRPSATTSISARPSGVDPIALEIGRQGCRASTGCAFRPLRSSSSVILSGGTNAASAPRAHRAGRPWRARVRRSAEAAGGRGAAARSSSAIFSSASAPSIQRARRSPRRSAAGRMRCGLSVGSSVAAARRIRPSFSSCSSGTKLSSVMDRETSALRERARAPLRSANDGASTSIELTPVLASLLELEVGRDRLGLRAAQVQQVEIEMQVVEQRQSRRSRPPA